MKLDKIILVNWGQLHAGDYAVGDLTLLTGETGAGKSTMLDGLQTVMTASYAGIFSYNPGQDELVAGHRRVKTKRTLESYVVGAEYSKFSRPDGAHAYLAAVFRPSKGEEGLKTFTALIGAAARVDGTGDTRQARLETLVLAIVDGADLSYSDLMLNPETGECVAVERIVGHLRAKYALVQDYNEKKRDYLSALYGRFRGKTSVTWDEASNAAKAWVQSIAYQPIGSVHELVRDEILDFDGKLLQQDIANISGLMRQVTNLRKESLRLEANIARLDSLKTITVETTTAFEKHVLQDLLLAKLMLKVDTETVSSKKRQISAEQDEMEQEDEKIGGWSTRVHQLDKQRIGLEARLLGIAAHVQKQELDTKLAQATAEARRVLKELGQSLAAAGLLARQANALIALPVSLALPLLNKAVAGVADALQSAQLPLLATCLDAVLATDATQELNVEQLFNVVQAFSGMNHGINQLFAALVGTDASVLVAAVAESTALAPRKTTVEARLRDLGASKTRLAAGGANYPNHVTVALQRLREQFPKANTQVLCDLVEPKSEEWQRAIEGYISGARFNIVVNCDWEAPALDYVRDKKLGVSVVQGSLCLKNSTTKVLPSDSIVHELKSGNPIAWAFLVEQYGTVVKVADAAALRFIHRGLTKDGRGSGSRSLFVVDTRALVFGHKAREENLRQVEKDLEIAQAEMDEFDRLKTNIDAARQMLVGLKEPSFEANPLRIAASDIDHLRSSLASLDLTESQEITDEARRVTEEIRVFNDSILAANKRLFDLEASAKGAQRVITAVEANRLSRLDAVDRQIARLKSMAEANGQLVYTVLAAQVEDQLLNESLDVETVKNQCELLAKRPDQVLGEVREALAEHNGLARPDERFVTGFSHRIESTNFDPHYKPLVELTRTISAQLTDLRGIGLYHNRSELVKAEASFHEVFTTQFCVAIKSKVDDGIRTLRQINRELGNLKFGTDSFSIDWSKWEPEFADYLSFFEAVTLLADSGEAVDLFADSALSQKHVEVRGRLVALLLDDNQERATKELLRIADYRNYRRYEIWSDSGPNGKIALSTWGTGSGGQLETPAYIVRAAVVTNRLKMFEKGASLKLLVNDESFSKMDEPRARAVLEYLRDTLDLQVISAMPTMKAGGLRDEFNREYSFTRVAPVSNGELDFMSECDERIYRTDKMRDLWSQHRKLVREQAALEFERNNPQTGAESDALAGGTAPVVPPLEFVA